MHTPMYSSDSESDDEQPVAQPVTPVAEAAPVAPPPAKRKYVRKEMTPQQKEELVARLKKAREAKAQKAKAPKQAAPTVKPVKEVVHVTNNYYGSVPDAAKPVTPDAKPPKVPKPKSDIFTAKPASRYSSAIW